MHFDYTFIELNTASIFINGNVSFINALERYRYRDTDRNK